jgi:hypothetical protein
MLGHLLRSKQTLHSRAPLQYETSFTACEWRQGRSGKLGSLFKRTWIEDRKCVFVFWFLQVQ